MAIVSPDQKAIISDGLCAIALLVASLVAPGTYAATLSIPAKVLGDEALSLIAAASFFPLPLRAVRPAL
jgi:hypothetical protein